MRVFFIDEGNRIGEDDGQIFLQFIKTRLSISFWNFIFKNYFKKRKITIKRRNVNFNNKMSNLFSIFESQLMPKMLNNQVLVYDLYMLPYF